MPLSDKEQQELQALRDLESKEVSEKKGFFTKLTETVTKFNLSESKFEDIFWDLEVTLME